MRQQSKSKLALIAFAVGMTLSLAASALPYPNPGEGYVQHYYSDAARTNLVGERSYGNCGESFQWGQTSRYFTLTKVVCGDGLP
ncbi:hypothetical protein A7A76_02030 [Lysobacter enzymogenes]|uniref:hypothetical protein n=1 Tax=Lysobacter enzymogenes TaxID=69 RepID=UPI0019D1255E|nr:hypothetical protein [Lysobacter enzymogenes]MBN7136593.1 hypothetical protein [Lysobacter enzymogenes]